MDEEIIFDDYEDELIDNDVVQTYYPSGAQNDRRSVVTEKLSELSQQRKQREAPKNNSKTNIGPANNSLGNKPNSSGVTQHPNVKNNLNQNLGQNKMPKASTGSSGMQGTKAQLVKSAVSNKNGDRATQIRNTAATAAVSSLGVPEPISGALVNSKLGQKALDLAMKNPKAQLLNRILGGKKKKTEEFADTGETNTSVFFEELRKFGLFAGIICAFIVVFVCVFMTAVDTFLNSMKLSQANSASLIDDHIKEMTEEEKYAELTDEDMEKLSKRLEKLTSYIDDTNSNFIPVARKVKKYKQETLDDLEQYYALINNYSKIYDMYDVYDFFIKINYIQKYYKKNYNGVEIDVPLLMATLINQSEDMGVVFSLNTENYDYETGLDNQYFDYNYDWSEYLNKQTSLNNSEHDIEMLVQHMVSYQAEEKCVDSSNKVTKSNIIYDTQIGSQILTCNDGETYSVSNATYVVDDDRYKEFLKEFIEKKYYRNTEDVHSSGGVSVAANFTKYTFEGDLLEQIASVCYREQGSVEGAAAEASLMANLFEKNGSKFEEKYGKTGLGLYHYVLESKWFGNPLETMAKKNAPSEAVAAVRSVLVDGKRTLPRYIDEHDCWNCNSINYCKDGKKGDICSINTNGKKLTSMSDIKKRNNYVKDETVISSVYDANYTFYSFPTSTSDPFGYLSEKLRQTYGECYYDFNTGKPVNCGSDFVQTFLSWLKSIAEDDSHGYSQIHREGLVDYDCSSLVYYGLINSGFTKEQLGTPAFGTTAERGVLKKNGFEEIKFSDLVPDGKTTTNLEPGDILWTNGHTEVYFGEGMNVGAHQSETNGITGEYGDQTGKEIYIGQFWNDNWQYVYRYRG